MIKVRTSRGTVNLTAAAPQGRVLEEIGPPPYGLVWELLLDGQTYIATASWPEDLDEETTAIPLRFTPDLPGRG